MKYLPIFLATASIFCSELKVSASDLETEKKEITKFLDNDLQNLGNKFDNKTFCETSLYEGPSYIYDDIYPKKVMVHAYNHGPKSCFISLELPIDFYEKVPEGIRSLISSKEIPLKNINISFVGQPGLSKDTVYEDFLRLRPNYWLHPTILDDNFVGDDIVSAGIFPITDSTIKLEYQPKDSLLDAQIVTHPVTTTYTDTQNVIHTYVSMVVSPDNLKILNYDREVDAFFCSLILTNEKDSSKRRATLTFHYVPVKENLKNLGKIAKNAKKISDLVALNELDYILGVKEWNFLKFPSSPKFDPTNYISLYPKIKEEAENNKMNLGEYAKWHFIEFGNPSNFDSDVYVKFYPGLKEEAENKKIDLSKYARWHFANFCYPCDFDPQIYSKLYPGLKEEAEKHKMDLDKYATWHFLTFGYPHKFDPTMYINDYPGIWKEAKKHGMGIIEYATWHFKTFGYSYKSRN